MGIWENSLVRRMFLPYYAVDQTACNNAQAQIQLIVQKVA
jgi:hypothetical protein